MNRKYLSLVIVTLLASWAIAVTVYFVGNFPFYNAVHVLSNGFMAAVLLLFFTALGTRLLRYTRYEFGSLIEQSCAAFGVGTGVMMLLVFLLAAIGALYKLAVVLLVMALFAVSYPDAKSLCIAIYNRLFTFSLDRKTSFEKLCLLFIGCAGIVTFFAAATPPFFYDALEYHLAVPQNYLTAHGFQYLPHNYSSNFPANLGMIFLIAMSFSDGMLAQLLAWAFTPLTALAVYAFARSRWGAKIAVTAAMILFFVPGILTASILTTIDPAVMFYSFLSFSAMLAWFASRQPRWIALSAIFCSLAVGTKYTALATTFLAMAVFFFLRECVFAKQSLVATVKIMTFWGCIVLAGMSPWILKNAIYTGNPVYPFFNSLFQAQGTEIMGYSEYLKRANSLFENGSPADSWLQYAIGYLKTPWMTTMRNNGAAGHAGMLFLIGLPALILLKKWDASLRYLLAIAGCAFGIWVFFLPGTLRYVFQMFPPLSLVMAYLLWNLPVAARVRTGMLTGVLLMSVYHFMIFFGEMQVLQPLNYLLANFTEEQYLLKHGVNYYPVAQYINRETPLDAKILFVGESRGYYCERNYELYTVLNSGFDDRENTLRRLIVESQTAAEVAQKLRASGLTHLLLNLPEMDRFAKTFMTDRTSFFEFETEAQQQIFTALFAPQYLKPLISREGVELYEIEK